MGIAGTGTGTHLEFRSDVWAGDFREDIWNQRHDAVRIRGEGLEDIYELRLAG